MGSTLEHERRHLGWRCVRCGNDPWEIELVAMTSIIITFREIPYAAYKTQNDGGFTLGA